VFDPRELADLLSDDQEIEPTAPLDMQQVKSNLPLYSNEKLCEMIVCDRYFGFQQQISTICMEELAARRISGNSFPFEEYIDRKYRELPVLDLTTPDLRTILQNAVKIVK